MTVRDGRTDGQTDRQSDDLQRIMGHPVRGQYNNYYED